MPKKQPGKPIAPPQPPTPPESARSFTPLLLVAFALVVAAIAVFVVRSVGPQKDAQSQSGVPLKALADTRSATGARPQPDAQTPPASTSSPARTSAGAAPTDSPPPPATAPKPHPQANLPALPFIGVPTARPIDVVRAVFQFAAEHAEVLTYVPCYCGCESQGHRGSEDCFVASRDAKGDVESWEPHGMTWAICLDVARDAMQMHYSGASVRDIRTANERKWSPTFPTHTPTPAPPAR